MKPALRIAGYDLSYRTAAGLRPALCGIDIEIAAGETLGLVGASGSGKTSLAWSILRMLPGNAREGGGTIALAGEDMRAMTWRQLAALRGRRIGMVFQDPATALNPSMRLGRQVTEVLVRHRRLAPQAAAAEAERWLARTGLPDPRAIMRRYPHQVSGGEKQRVVIAAALRLPAPADHPGRADHGAGRHHRRPHARPIPGVAARSPGRLPIHLP